MVAYRRTGSDEIDTPYAVPAMTALQRNNVVVHGPPDARPMVFAHGFGCDQNMWRFVWPAFADDHRIVLFDHVGAGGSDASAYDRGRYASLQGYADDVLEICRELDLTDVVFVGHSVSAMIGVLAAAAEPERFGRLVLVGPVAALHRRRRTTPAASPARTSRACSSPWTATTSAGRARWRR